MSSDYWRSPAGIDVRLKNLAEAAVYRAYNDALTRYAPPSIWGFEWVTSYFGSPPCDYCDSQSGRRYRRGQFTPRIPNHVGCRCTWDIIYK